MSQVLVIDDDRNVRELVLDILGDGGYRAAGAQSGAHALRQLQESPADLVLLDLDLPGEPGQQVLPRVKALAPPPAVIILTADRRIESVIEMMRLGADDYIVKPVDEASLLFRVARVLESRSLRSQILRLRQPGEIDGERHGLLGASPLLHSVLSRVALVAGTDVSVMISGESGTGKELVARAIHEESARASGPFVVCNCASIPQSLLEDALFGHVRGAFTGAIKELRGLFEEAGGGTLFLDEIAEAIPEVQVKLLRAVENRVIRPIGADRDVGTDVRIVAATNRDLRAEIAAGRFRADLHYRLSVFPIEMPPLRDRAEDIPLLARGFASRFSSEIERPFAGFDEESVRAMKAHPWPGNIRQLENVVKQAVLLAAGSAVSRRHLGPLDEATEPPASRSPSSISPYAEAKAAFERGYLESLLRASGGNVLRAAQMSGIDRKEIYARVRKFGLRLDEIRDASP